jgi:hypothetical protein
MNEAAEVDGRHLTAESFDRCLRSSVPVEHPIKGQPPITLFIDPDRAEIGLRVPAATTDVPFETERENVRLRATHRPEGRFLEVVIDDPRLFAGAYPVLCGIADRVQIDGLSLASALASTIRLLDQLLRRDSGLALEREVGLLGELLILRSLCGLLGAADAIAAWRSGEAEEHDFAAYGIDVEVKTTSSERRTHWIASLTQMVPTGDRPLWLVSHQLTRAGAGEGRSLPEVVADVRAVVGEGETRASLERRLTSAGWADAYGKTIRDRWLRRAPSLAFLVGADFPRLTPALLNDAGLSLVRISDVRYRIDLTGLPPATQLPDILVSILTSGDTS